jgi:hypothetical protein
MALSSAVIVGSAGGLHAQGSDALYARFTALSGWEVRGFTFGPGIGTKSVWQWNMPLVVVAPLGRKMSVDLTTHYASGRVATYAGATETLSGLTDTQVRLLYTVSRDRLVGSFSFNLPTGDHTVSTGQFQVAGAVSSTYLSFPVSNTGTAFGATGGLAYARRAGAWNLGASGSLRYLGTYSPFSGDTLSYSPGMEARLRGGADRVLGEKSRLLLGVTVSTFSTDVYTGSSALVAGSYSPGTRFIGELALVRVIGRSTLTLAAWDFYRLAGTGSSGPNPETRENVLNGELRLTYPVTPRLRVEPLIAFRQWNPSDYVGGRLKSGGVLVRAGLTDRLSVAVTGRYDDGWIFARASGLASLKGYGASLFLRFER